MSEDRWSRYTVTDSGCWEWGGYMDSNGYPRMVCSLSDGRRESWAHRAFYDRFKGQIPPRYEIDHTCQNPPCVNPDHLDAVTKTEHVRRTMQRLGKDDLHHAAAMLRAQRLKYEEIAEVLGLAGRESAYSAVQAAIAKGLVDGDEVPRRRHLTDAEKDDVRLLYVLGMTQPDIAALYGVDDSHVSRILARKSSRLERGSAA